MSRVLLTGADIAFERRTRSALNGLSSELQIWRGDLSDPETAAQHISQGGVEVVMIGTALAPEEAIRLAGALDRLKPELVTILIAQPTPQTWAAALQAGVRDLCAPSASNKELKNAIERAIVLADRRRASVAVAAAPAAPTGRVITVLSPKGGAGKTTVSSNLGVGLAQRAPGKAVLVDLDLDFGDVSTALLLTPEHTMFHATRNVESLDLTTLKVFLSPHQSGLYALCAPPTPAEGEQISAAAVQEVIRRLSSQFPFVVVDTAAGLNEHALAAVELSTDLVLISDMDVPSVRGLRKVIDALDTLGLTASRRHLVLNRSDTRVGLTSKDVGVTLGLPVDVEIPSSRLVPLSVNQGSPLLETLPRSDVGRSLTLLVDRFAPDGTARSAGLWRWRRP